MKEERETSDHLNVLRRELQIWEKGWGRVKPGFQGSGAGEMIYCFRSAGDTDCSLMAFLWWNLDI